MCVRERNSMNGFAACDIRKYRGAPAVFVNGRPVPPMSFMVREYFDAGYIKRYVDSGHRICFLDVKEQHHLPIEEHLAGIDEHLIQLTGLSKDLYIIFAPYISLGKTWLEAHPDDVCRYADGSVLTPSLDPMPHRPGYLQECYQGYYSFASQAFEKETCKRLRRYVRFLGSRPYADRIIGFFTEAGSTHEWNEYAGPAASDYSPVMHEAFRRFIKARYRTVDRLRKAWGDSTVTFESVRVPSKAQKQKTDRGLFRDPSCNRRMIDFFECHADCVVDRMIAFARTVKRASSGRLLTGFYHGVTIDGSPGGKAWKRYFNSPHIDFCASPLGYEDRTQGAHNPLHTVVDTVHLHNKVFFSEDDLRPAWPVRDKRAESSIKRCGGDMPLQDSLEIFKKEIMQNVVNGVQGYWYDFHFKWYDRPHYWKLFKRLNRIFKQSFANDRRKCSEIAIIMDEESHRYVDPENRVCRNLYHRQMLHEMGRLGAGADIYLHDDLDHPDMPDYRMYVFLNCFRLTGRARRRIERLKRDGRLLLFFYGQGFVNDEARQPLSVQNMAALTGLHFREVDDAAVPLVTMSAAGHALLSGLTPGMTFGQHFRPIRHYTGHLFPPGIKAAPLFEVVDRDAVILGHYCHQHDTIPAMAYRDFGDWRSLYTGTLAVPAAVLRAAARMAGCHLYLDTDDVVYASRRYLVVYASAGDGPRTIRLPRRTDVWDVMHDRYAARKARSFTVDMKRNTTAAYLLGPRPVEC